MASEPIVSLAELVSPQPERVFLDHYLRKIPLHIRSGNPQKFEHLVPWSALNALFDQNSFHLDSIRVMRDGRTVPESLYRKQDRPQYLDGERLKALCEQGTSIVVNSINKLLPAVGMLAQVCELALRERVNINAYLTVGLGGAFRTHYDSHDVLVVQVHGNKRWQLFDEPEEYPIHEENKPVPAKRNVVFDEKLEAGDILYVPRGVYHRAEIESEDSLHLAVGINARKGVTFVQWLEKKLAQDSLLRQDIPVLAGAEELAEYELALKRRIASELAAVSLADFLAEIDARRGKLVSFNFGPSPSPSEDDVVRALIRRRSAGRGYSAQANAIMEVLLPRVSMSFGELKSACVQGDDVLRSALDELAKAGVVSVTPATPERARI